MRNVTQDSMGDNMKERKQLSPAYLERLAEDEYDTLKGRLARVKAINGYVGEATSDTVNLDMTGKPVIVRIDEANVRDDIHRWMDEWLDPAYPVTIVERGDLPVDFRSCWIYGNCRSLDGGFEPGDIWSVETTRKQIKENAISNARAASDKEYLGAVKLMEQQKHRINPNDLAARLGGKVCDPPQRYRHLMGFMRPHPACGPSEETKAWVEKRQRELSGEAVEAYDQLADRKETARRAVVEVALEDMTAEEVGEWLKKSLKMPIDAGQQALKRTDRLLAGFERLEDLERRVKALETKISK